MFLRGDRSIEFEMAEKSRQVDPSNEFQNRSDEEALLREDAGGADNCNKDPVNIKGINQAAVNRVEDQRAYKYRACGH